jgi:outer membrane protein OmpA-like peptidoglycan-associated protein
VTDPKQRSQDIAEILPTALNLVSESNELAAALQTPVDHCVKTSLQQDPKPFAKAIMPIMAPVLKKTIAEALRSLREFLHQQQIHLEQLENRIGQLEQGQITDLLNRLAYIEQNVSYLNDLEQQVHSLERTKISQLYTQVDDLTKQVQETVNTFNQQVKLTANSFNQQLESQVQGITTAFHQRLEAQTREIVNTFNRRLESLETDKLKSLANTFQQQLESQTREIINTFNQRLESLETDKLKPLAKRIALLERGMNRIHDLETFLMDAKQRVKDMANFLPRAIREATEATKQTANPTSDNPNQIATPTVELIDSLLTPVEECLRRSVHQDAHNIANALFPVMGPAIRRSINETFKSIVQSVNTSLEHSLSPQGLAWRVEAIRTGKPFADIVLKNTLAYRVEQIFFIHRETGLLIQHLSQDGTEIGDSEAISAMLTAIQDFIRDSFSRKKNEELDKVEIGEYTVWLERGPKAILACVIRGVTPDESLRVEMRQLLEKLHIRYAEQLTQFSGDNTALEAVKMQLQRLLKTEEKPVTKSKSPLPKAILIAAVAFSLLIGIGSYFHLRHQQLLENYIQALEKTPGLVLFSTELTWSQVKIRGLRDPIAEDPLNIAQTIGLNAKYIKSQWTAYQDLNPHFVEQRIRQWLKPPSTIQIITQNGVLHIKGYADDKWIEKLNHNLVVIADMSRINLNELIDENAFLSQTEADFNRYVKALKNTPGIVIIATGIEDKKRFINGLLDPLAEQPNTIAKQINLPLTVFNNITMHWNQYQDLTPQLVEKRAKYQLNPPTTVQLTVANNILYLKGHASPEWINSLANKANTIAGVIDIQQTELLTTDQYLLNLAQQELASFATVKVVNVQQGVLQLTGHVSHAEMARLPKHLSKLPGITRVDKQQLIDRDLLIQDIEKINLHFKEEADFLEKMTELDQLIQQLQKLTTIYSASEVTIHLIGDTDGLGTQLYNEQLSRQRAQKVYNWLTSHGIASDYLVIQLPNQIKFGATTPNFSERKVNCKVILTSTGATMPLPVNKQ